MNSQLRKYGQPSKGHRRHTSLFSRLLRAIQPQWTSPNAAQRYLPELLEPRQFLSGNVLISEIMYHPGFGDPGDSGYIAEDTRQEYIELFNPTSAPVNLKDWQLTQGVSFVFPDVTIPANGYLVVAADLNAFNAKYPTVTNVVGPWQGQLSNNGEDLELENPLGQRVDFVSYATEGDWALRRRVVDDAYPTGLMGWGWISGADAGLKSLELINPAVSNEFGQNWAASLPDQGTPGQPNSVASTNIAPIVLDVEHLPLIPKSTDPVTVTAKVSDELTTGLTVTLHYRIDGQPAFTSQPMFDDGLHNDDIANDGVYAATLPAQPDKTIVEFYVQATDSTGHTRSWPAPSNDAGTEHAANALYQVDNTVYTGNQPIYRIITPKAEWDTWYAQMSKGHPADYSNAAMNATFISIDGQGSEIRYNASVRNRGEGSRSRTPHNFLVKIPQDHPWHNITSLALNTQYTWSQVAGNAIFAMAGLPAPYGKPVQVRLNSDNLASSTGRQYGSYFLFEPYGNEWAEAHSPSDSNGNIYKGVMYGTYGPADLRWVPDTNPSAPADWITKAGYEKQSNTAANDWSDLTELLWVLNKTPNDLYTQEVSRVVNVDEWLSYFAVNFLIGNRENSLGGTDDNTNPSVIGDDYSMYCGTEDKRFQLLVHDMDTILGQGDTAPNIQMPLFPTWRVPTIDKFLKWKDFAPRYYQILYQQIQTTFAPENINPLLDQLLGGWMPASNIADMKKFVVDRNTYVLSQIPLALSATNPPTTSTASTVSLTGLANAITTRSVKVNGIDATWSAWEAKWTAPSVALHPGNNHIIIQSFDANGQETDHTYVDVRYDTGSVTTVPGGTLTTDTTWTLANSPYQLTGSLTIPAGKTLTIQPGVSIYLPKDATITVANGGKLLAEGTNAQRIVISAIPNGSPWGGIVINGGPSSPETRIAYTHIVGNNNTAIDSIDGTILLDHLTFGTTSKQYLVVDRSSFLVQDCEFPATTASFEPVHGVGDVKAGGHGIFLRNYFGPITGYNDTIDYTGGQRPGAIVQFIDNVFAGSGDDNLDVDSTDAWVQGNIFLHVHKNGPPDTSSAVSGGNDNGNTSEVTIIGNIIYDVDQVANAKQGNFYTLLNNTIVHQTHVGGLDTEGALIVMQDNGMTEGRGMYLGGNIVYDIEKYLRDPGDAVITLSNNLLPLPWTGPGAGNLIANPGFKYIPKLSETYFTNWTQAQVMKDWFSLVPGTAAVGTGPNGADKGALIPPGVSISGEPVGTTSQTSATLIVGSQFTGNAIPTTATGFPNGSGYTHYKYRLDGGAWSDETPITTPISLTNLSNGPHTVDVIGKNDAGLYQNDPLLGPSATISHSRTWTVDAALPPQPALRLNEILARNTKFLHGATAPDMIELYNSGPTPIDLSGMGVTDNAAMPAKFVFPDGTTLAPDQYLVLYADGLSIPGEFHLGFSIENDSESLYLYSAGATPTLIDSVTFGIQVPDLSIGRLADGSWGLTQPTFGAPNIAQPLGDPRSLKINEWLADGRVLFHEDFVELYNPQSQPVALAGMYFTDNPVELPHLQQFAPELLTSYQIRPLSFIGANSQFAFHADGNHSIGANHTNFKLEPTQGMIGLFDSDLALIDQVIYGQQSTDVSQGRSPDASGHLAFFPLPTPGAPNPGIITITQETKSNLFDFNKSWKFNQTDNLDTTPTWKDPTFNDSAWSPGTGVLYVEPNIPANLKGTPLTLGRDTYYFRTHFTFNGTIDSTTLLELSAWVDDGAVIYLNGHEVKRLHMAEGTTVTYSTHAQDHEAALEGPIDIPATYLQVGDNVLAVEVHQVSSGSSDIAWGAKLDVVSRTTTTTITNPIPENITNLENSLRITELMYNPIGGSDYEYLELKNTGAKPLDLTGVRISNGVDFVFPSMTLQPGQYVLVVANQALFESRYGTGLSIAGQFTGRFSNSGENVVLQLPAPYDAAILRFDFSPLWYPATNGNGYSLVFIDPAQPQASWSDPAAWRPSVLANGSPGAVDQGTPAGAVVINEVLAHTDASPVGDWIELHNTTSEPFDISGWYLSDDGSDLTKYRIAPNTLIPAHGYLVFNQFQQFDNPADPGCRTPFGLSEFGDAVYLTSAAADGSPGTYRESVSFGASDREVTFGRYHKSTGEYVFVPMASSTPGQANAADPLVGPVVINELMYHPLAGDEYIELHNITNRDIPLYDPAHPENTWRFTAGITYDFPQNVTISANGYLLVVPIDPATFRTKYNIPVNVPIVGPFTGGLSNGGELIALSRPGDPELPPAPLPYIQVDSVWYGDAAPWPVEPDGAGQSLARLASNPFGDDPASWTAANPTPGLNNSGVTPITTLTLQGAASDTFRLQINGSNLEVFRNSSSSTDTVPLADLTQIELQGGHYTIDSNLTGLRLVLSDATDAVFATSQTLASLTLSASARATLAPGGNKILRTSALSLLSNQATLDLTNNALILSASAPAKLTVFAGLSQWIKSARGADGKWLGSGVGSSAANANKQTGLAFMLNDKSGKPILTTFAGQSVNENDILVKYTWNGDVNLDGVIDAADYFLVDSGFITQQGGYRNGDLNQDGTVDAADYFLIDSAFIAQTGPLDSGTPALITPTSTGTSGPLFSASAPKDTTPTILQQLFSTQPIL